MKLEAVTAELRPRTDAEAVDLGLALVRRDFWRASGAWWLGMAPVAVPGAILLWGSPGWFCVLFWWWLPIGSRMALLVLSRHLFGERLGWGTLLRQLPGMIGLRFFHRMVVARFSPMRPLTMPVEMLEGLRGTAFRSRCRALMRRGDSGLIMLAIWRLLLAGWLAIAVFATIVLFVPAPVREMWMETLMLWKDGLPEPASGGMTAAITLSVCGAMALVDLYSAGAGFGMYVNHRTWVEGWDIELAFRRIGARLGGTAAALIAAAVVFSGAVLPVRADEAAEAIERVLAHEDFVIHQETTRVPKWDGWDWDFGGSVGGLGNLVEFLGWALLIATVGTLLAALGWLIYRYRHVFQGRGGVRVPPGRAGAAVVMGMDVRPESLPEDVPAVALRWWREGRRAEALALLYRASISWMIAKGGIAIAESDTESDCLRRVEGARLAEGGYFSKLTDWRIRLSYAREEPGDDVMEELCGAWPFGEGRSA